MAIVINILRDGTRADDLTGHVVKISEAEAVYRLMDSINRGVNNENKDTRYRERD